MKENQNNWWLSLTVTFWSKWESWLISSCFLETQQRSTEHPKANGTQFNIKCWVTNVEAAVQQMLNSVSCDLEQHIRHVESCWMKVELGLAFICFKEHIWIVYTWGSFLKTFRRIYWSPHLFRLLIGAEDTVTKSSLLFLFFSSFFLCPFVHYYFTSAVSSTQRTFKI